jgi:hypothetical protein
LQQQSDIQLDQYKKETDVLKVQFSNQTAKIMSQQGHDSVILNSVEAKIKEYNVNELISALVKTFVPKQKKTLSKSEYELKLP